MSGNIGAVRGAVGGFDLAGLLNGWRAWRARRREIARITYELGLYTDGELAELGLGRGDIPDVARGTYARD